MTLAADGAAVDETAGIPTVAGVDGKAVAEGVSIRGAQTVG